MSESLQARIEALASGFPGSAGVAARHLGTGAEVRVNDTDSFPTASMIKILILFELVRQCAKGQAHLWERVTLRDVDKTLGSGLLSAFDAGANLTLRDLAVMMMAISDNTATNVLIDRLGQYAINQACRDARMFDTELRGKIDFEKLRASPDNLAVTTPRDFVTFLTALRRGELIPAGYVEQVLDVMRIQKYIEPIRKRLPVNPYAREFGEAEEVWVASKTGGLQGVRCEGGLVHTPRAEWALCVMTRGFNDPVWSADNRGAAFISTISRLIYDAWQ